LWDTRKKDFFFEKKKQKTFAHFALYVWQHTFCDFNGKKFFGSFFQKRTLLPSSRATYLNASLVIAALPASHRRTSRRRDDVLGSRGNPSITPHIWPFRYNEAILLAGL